MVDHPIVLPRHPAPKPTESLYGYGLRLSVVNGYETIAGILRRARVAVVSRNRPGFDIQTLARLTGRSSAEFQHLLHTSEKKKRSTWLILSNPVLEKSLSLKLAKICPACVQEKGFIEAHFDLNLMVGCPVHQCELLSVCSQCGVKLSWFRPDLLRCKCGARLSGSSLQKLPTSEIEILNCLRCKVFGEQVQTGSSVGVPLGALSGLELKSLLNLLQYLGTCWLEATGQITTTTSCQVLSAASLVLSDWPNNFHGLLTKLESQLSRDTPFRLSSGPFAGIYQKIRRGLWLGNRMNEGEFIKVAFKDFFVGKHADGLIDGKMLRGVETQRFGRYQSMRGFAKLCRVSNETAIRRANEGMVDAHKRRIGAIDRWVVDVESAGLQSTPSPGKIHPHIQTARFIGISKAVLKELVESGDFEIVHKVDWTQGYHELDIQGFIQRFNELASRSCTRLGECSESQSIHSLVHGTLGSVKAKASLVRRVLSGNMPILGKQDETVGGVLLPRKESRCFLRDHAARNSGTRSQKEAAQLLRCSRRDVRALLDEGFLNGKFTAFGLQIEADSLAKFASRYSCLVRHAKALGTSCSALARWCELAGIPLVSVMTSYKERHRLFIQKQDVFYLKGFVGWEKRPVLDYFALKPDHAGELAILPNNVTVRGLVSLGLLHVMKYEKRWWWVRAESLIAFNQEYVPVASIAAEVGMTTKEAVRSLEEGGIEVIFTSIKNKSTAHAFIRASDRLFLSIAA